MLNKRDNIFQSKLFLKFINNWCFLKLKIKIEQNVYQACFYWKKYLGFLFILYFFESIITIRPLIGFYRYIIKKKRRKIIKIIPHYMSYYSRWNKGIFWFVRSIQIRYENKLYLKVINELFDINFLKISSAIKHKLLNYKIVVLYKSSKNYKW